MPDYVREALQAIGKEEEMIDTFYKFEYKSI